MGKHATVPGVTGWTIAVLGLGGSLITAHGAPVVLDSADVLREYTVTTWRHEQGLPDNRVKTILQTRDGYLWIGTQRGLARFDGQKFTVFDHLNTQAMRDDDCGRLTEDVDGNLWISTHSRLVLRRGDQFAHSSHLPGGISAYALCAARNGGIWAAFNNKACSVRDTGAHLRLGTLLRTGYLSVMEEGEDGTLLLAADSELARFEPEQERFMPPVQQVGFEGLAPRTFCRADAGRRWVLFSTGIPPPSTTATPPQPGWLACLEDGRWVRTPNPAEPDFQFEYYLTFVVADRFDMVWLPATENVIHRFANGRFQSLPIPHQKEKDYPLCALADREGNLWIGTEASGLQRWTPRRIVTHTSKEGLPHDITWTVCEAQDGSVWIGTDGGLTQWKDGRFVSFTQTNGLVRNEVRAVAEDRDGTIWVGTLNGLDSIRGGQISHVRFPGEWFETKIRALLAARDGGLWIGTVRGLTHLRDGQRTKCTPADGLAAQEVRSLLEDRHGSLWIGTFGGGLSCLREGKFTTLATTNGLSNNNVWALHEDADGVLWIGTERGLNRLKDGQLTAFTTQEGLPDDLVNTLLEDEFGRLWIGHDRGLYWVAKSDLDEMAAGRASRVTAVCYDQTDGLLTTEFNGQKSFPAACKFRDGRLLFATAKGVAVIDPCKVALDATPPLTVIEEIRAGGEAVLSNSLTTETTTNASSDFGRRTTHLHLPPGRGRILEFRYTANTFVAPEKAKFRYRMLGQEPGWIDVGTRREVFFTDLRPGNYEFEIIAANHHGVWPERGARIAVHLAPFLYQTWWFYTLCGITAAAFLGAFVAWRLREVRRIGKLQQQAAIVGERTRIAKDLHDGLGADLSRLALLADLAGGDSPADTGVHMQKLSRTSRQATRDLKELIWLANPINDTMESLVSRLCQTTEDLLRDAQIRCRLDVPPHLPQHPLSLEQRRSLLLVIREALNNIIKHAAATEVCLRAQAHDGGMQIMIEDDGRGFTPATVRPGTLGLASMRQRIESLGGSFKLESSPGTGTRIVMEVRFRNP